MASLPQDIVFEIFARLPTKPLVRSRCLSKHWNRLISDYFMKSRSRRMILLPLKPPQAMHNTVPGDVSALLISALGLPYPFINLVSEDRVKIIGTFEGIVVLLCKNIILFNPLTGAFKLIVPDPPLDYDYHSRDTYGLCYGATLDDLKIVKLRLCTHYSYQVYCDVFSLKKGLWSTSTIRLEGKYSASPLYCGTFANGFLYWIVEEVLDRRIRYILIALDVKEMVISKILPLPPNFNSRDSLGTLSGRLHFLYRSIMTYELWVMNEDGMEKSWSKVLTLNINNALSGFHIPLSIIDTGKIVIMNGHGDERELIIYDIFKDSQEIYEVRARYLNRVWKLQAMEYVESLISPSHLYSNW